MLYIVTAESKSLFNYGIRTDKIFRPTQSWTFRGAGNQKNPDSDVGFSEGEKRRPEMRLHGGLPGLSSGRGALPLNSYFNK